MARTAQQRLPMVKVNRVVAWLSLVALAAGGGAMLACGGASESPAPPATTEQEPQVTNPVTGLAVSATIASASLGSGSANMQIAFFASEATAPASVSIAKVLLVNGKSGATVATLDASSPGVWNGRSYEPWNQQVTPGGDLRASYALSAPDWSVIEGSGGRGTSYSSQFKLRVTLLIDGTEVTIDSDELQREPEVAT